MYKTVPRGRSISPILPTNQTSIEKKEKRKLNAFLNRLFRNPAFLLFVTTLIVYTLCLNALWETDHPTSFLELAWAIWHNHSFALAKVVPSLLSTCQGSPIQYSPPTGIVCTVDDFHYNGYYYSALAPGTVILMLPFTIVGFIVNHGFSLYNTPLVYSEFLIALTNAIAVVMVYKISRFYFKEATSIFLAFAYAFSTISWPLATFIFQSDPSAAFDLVAAFFVLRVSRAEKASFMDLIYCGLALTIAVTIDYVNVILVPMFLFYILFSVTKESFRTVVKDLLGFVASAFIGIFLIGVYNYVNFGSFFKTSESLYLHHGLFASFSARLDIGLLMNLVTPYRGLFFYSPILILGIIGFYKMLRSDVYGREAILLLALFLGVLFPYSKWYALDAGLSYGPRFIVPAIPFLLIPVGFMINDARQGKLRVVAYVLYSVGVVTNGIAAFTSALAGTEHYPWLGSPFLNSALPLYLKGTMDSWLFGSFPHSFGWPFSVWTSSLLIIFIAIILPLVGYRKMRRYESPK